MSARWPVCGACCDVAMFSWMGGAHHCVVADPAEAVDESRLNPQSTVSVPAPTDAAHAAAALNSPAGLVGYVEHVNRTRAPFHPGVIHFTGTGSGHQVEIAAQWNAGNRDTIRTFVNSAPTEDGGPHRDGFYQGLTGVLNAFARRHTLITADGPDLSAADFAGGLTAVIVVKVTEPRFADESERQLLNPEIQPFVANVCTEHLTGWLETNPDCAKAVVRKAILSYASRTALYRSHFRNF
ncbi:hypothetical protein KIH27_05790 [Mycobacterium sp. M1]|uniref:DNA topoisomerase (ATP-hydrolyzing) n=1 Tax=Mycolicibacter acidiphilus TaxID=2835306 RepID=A0ABS5RFP4_9MYCO|nr:hypothetical protein [Mycolicibacter acidiphilus]MBS9533100.1 hypothetical protein [Mycolicibacter acidiphilus]